MWSCSDWKIRWCGTEYSLHSSEDYLGRSRVGRKLTLVFNDMWFSTVIQQAYKELVIEN